jgi:hypothetical protein
LSRINKVIILNKPFKLMDFTIRQILLLVVIIGLGLLVFSRIPQQWKLGHLPVNFLVLLGFVCVGLPMVKFTDLKPMAWWKNVVLYKLKLVPAVFIPKPEKGHIYPDPTIVEVNTKKDEFYIGSG